MKARLLAVLVVVAVGLGLPAPAPAAVEMPDFATRTYGDPWDFSNRQDFAAPLQGWTTKASNLAVTNGKLSFDMTSMGELALVRGFGSIAIPWGRDGSIHPIDAAKYTRLSFSLNAQIPVATPGQVTWMTCGTLAVSCQGGQPVTIKPGWNTYDFALRNEYQSLPKEWSGMVQSLSLVPIGGNVAAGHFDIDWIRLYDPTGSGETTPLNRLEPEPKRGGDYASIIRGDTWDFSQPSDLLLSRNAAVSFDGASLLRGQNDAPVMNDPFLIFPTPTPFSGTRFHRFSIRIFYDGKFSLEDNVGGGMNGRVMWNVAGSDVLQVSQDILIYPGWQTITFDMNAPGIIDETQVNGRIGWAGQTITSLRFDPNEDRGPRNWVIDWVRLGSDRPFGSLDVVRRDGDGFQVAGWSIDPNTTDATHMRVFVDDTRYAIAPAGEARGDIGAIFPAFGAAHGFSGVVPAPPGTHRVCAWAINIGPGGHGLIGCKVVS